MSTKLSLFAVLLVALFSACTPKPAEESASKTGEPVEAQRLEVEGAVVMPSEEPAAGEAVAANVAPTEANRGELPEAELALFDLSDSSAPAVKQMVASLNGDRGVMSAKVLAETNQLQVTFKPGETNPHKMLQALQGVDTKATLAQVKAVDGGEKPAGHAGCGGCPKADSCAGKH